MFNNEVDVEECFIISFNHLHCSCKQEEAVFLYSRSYIKLGLSKDLPSLIEEIKRIAQSLPEVMDGIEIHAPRHWLEENCEEIVVVTEEAR